MFIKLFDFSNGVLIPSEACYSLKSLKEVMDTFPDNYLKVYLYIFYLTCPDPNQNPFFNLPEDDKQEFILLEIQANFSTDSPVIQSAIDFCNKVYDTPTKRAYEGMKIMMDKIAQFFKIQTLSTGRDGSLDSMTRTAVQYKKLRESFKGIEDDYNEEIKNRVRGDRYKSYDQ
jgi:hypothetical protein